jgi:8-amino-7-oxononanoate synthase
MFSHVLANRSHPRVTFLHASRRRYAANCGVLQTLADGADVTIFSDALNHASIVDGCRLASRTSGAKVVTYAHCDVDDLERKMTTNDGGGGGGRRRRNVVVTDSLFSMDGDFAPIRALVALKTRHPGTLLIVDEAHATLVCGATGGGAVEACGVDEMNGLGEGVDVHVGTLSKAFGSHGGACTLPTASAPPARLSARDSIRCSTTR